MPRSRLVPGFALRLGAGVLVTATPLVACEAFLTNVDAGGPPSSPDGPEGTCAKACESRTDRRCEARQCSRGCNLVLDRLLEHEGEHVLACVASRSPALGCGDRTWAGCAARIGPHADGGPPPPAPAATDLDDSP